MRPGQAWRRLCFLLLCLILGEVSAQGSTPAPWSLYGADLANTRTVTSGITSENAADLEPLWQVEVGGAISATPVFSNNTAYVGSYDGNLYAFDLDSGETRWVFDTETDVLEPNLDIPLGIIGSAAVVDDTVYVGDAAANVYALAADTGEIVWQTRVDEQPAAAIWSSPVVWRDQIFLGVASISKEQGFRGNVVALDRATGELSWRTWMVPEGADGAGVFAVPAVDTERGVLYVGTQNAYSEAPQPYGDPISVVALELKTGARQWVFQAPQHEGEVAPTVDFGFSASPNLFSAEIEGKMVDLVGVGQKSGVYWALNRNTGEVVWQAEVSPSGPLGGMEGSSGVAEGKVAIPATNWSDPAGPASGLFTVLDAATGEQQWRKTFSAPLASPTAITREIVLQGGMDGFLRVLSLEDGEELWSFDLGTSVSGGIAVSGNTVVLGAATPAFAPFVKSGSSVWAFRLK